MERVDAVYALIYNDEKLLLVKNINGHWDIPGGTVEQGETLIEACEREVREETGYGIQIRHLSSLREMFLSVRNQHILAVTFYAEVSGGKLAINDPDNEIIEVRWVDFQTAIDLIAQYMKMHKIESFSSLSQAFYAFEGQI